MNWNEKNSGRNYASQVAQHRGWILNPDEDLTGHVTQGLESIARRLGKPYCPCRDVDGGPQDVDVVCPCRYAQADVDQYGQCFCGLFLDPDKASEEVGSIPERRDSE